MKGLSPVVATIMLIAFAVAVGGLVSIWLTGFATSTTEFTSKRGDELTLCAGARLDVDSVTATGIVYSNPSSRAILNITVYDGNGRNLTFNASNLSPSQVTNLTWARGTNTSILLRGICENSVPVKGECKDGQGCWK